MLLHATQQDGPGLPTTPLSHTKGSPPASTVHLGGGQPPAPAVFIGADGTLSTHISQI